MDILQKIKGKVMQRLFVITIFSFMAVILGASVGVNSDILSDTNGTYAYAQDEDQLSPDSDSGDTATPDQGSSDSSTTTGSANVGNQVNPNSTSDDFVYDPYADSGRASALSSERTSASELSPKVFADQVLGGGEEKSGYSSLSDSSHYLAFSRWWQDLSQPSPYDFYGVDGIFDAIGVWVGGFAMFIAMLIFFAFGLALIFTLSINLLAPAALKADEIFANIVNYIAWNQGGEQAADLSTILTFVLGGIIFVIMYRLFKINREPGNGTGIFKPFLVFVFGAFFIAFVGSQSAKNHEQFGSNNMSAIGEASAGSGESPSKLAGSPENWATGSLGWGTAMINKGAGELQGVLSSITSIVIGSMNSGISGTTGAPAPTECDLYTQGLHAVYQSSAGARNMDSGNLLVSYDNMLLSTVFNMYRMGAFGDSEGSGGAWCRALEASSSSPPGEQAMVSRVAGLYPELVGQGGMGMVAEGKSADSARPTNMIVSPADKMTPGYGGRQFNVASGTLVAADGNWTDVENRDHVGAAQRFFGPTYPSKAGAYESKFYFAGCMYQQGQPAQLRPEWENVISASDNLPLTDASCTDSITSGSDHSGGFGWVRAGESEDEGGADMRWNYSPFHDDVPYMQDQMFEDQDDDTVVTKIAKKLGNVITPDAVVDARNQVSTLSGMSIDSQNATLSKFNNAENAVTERVSTADVGDRDAYPGMNYWHNKKAGNQPKEYFEYVSGAKSMSTLTYGLAALVISIMLAKPFAGLILGALGAQMLAAMTLIIMSLLVILLLIPSKSIRDSYKTGGMTVISAYIVTAVLTILFALIMGITEFLFSAVDVDGMDGIAKVLAVALILFGTVKGSLWVINKFFQIDLSNMKDTAKVMSLAGSPALNKMGASVATPFDIAQERARDLRNRVRRPSLSGRRNRRMQEQENKEAINALNTDSSKNRQRKLNETERAAKAKELSNSQAMMDQAKKSAEKKSRLETAKDKVLQGADKFNNSRLGKIAKSKSARMVAKKVPYLGQAVIGMETAGMLWGKYKNARDFTAGTWAKGKQGNKALKNMLANISPDGENGSNLGDQEMNEKMGVVGANQEDHTDHTVFRTKETNATAKNLQQSPIRNLVRGATRNLLESSVGKVDADADMRGLGVATTQEDVDKVIQTAPGMLPASTQSNSNSIADSMAQLNNAINFSRNSQVDSKDMFDLVDQVKSLSDMKKLGAHDLLSVSLNDADAVATALGADFAAFPQRMNINESAQAGINMVPGSDQSGTAVVMPNYGNAMNNLRENPAEMQQAMGSWAAMQTGMENLTHALSNSAAHASGGESSMARRLVNDISQTLGLDNMRNDSSVPRDLPQQIERTLERIASTNFVSSDSIRELQSYEQSMSQYNSQHSQFLSQQINNLMNYGAVDNSMAQQMPQVLRESSQGGATDMLAKQMEQAVTEQKRSNDVMESIIKRKF